MLEIPTIREIFADICSDSDSHDTFCFTDSSSSSDSDNHQSDDESQSKEPAATEEVAASQTIDDAEPTAASGLGKRRRRRVGLFRGGAYLSDAREALESWLDRTYEETFAKSSLDKDAIISPKLIASIAHRRSIKTFEDLKDQIGSKWHFLDKYGCEVIEVLEKVERRREEKVQDRQEKDRQVKSMQREAKKRQEKENEMLYGKQYEFIMYDPTATKRTRKKRAPLSQMYPPVAGSSSTQ